MPSVINMKNLTKEDLKNIAAGIGVCLLFMLSIISFANYDNALYQTQKNLMGAIGIAAFLAILMYIRNVNVLNIYSGIATVILGLIAAERLYLWRESIDIEKILIGQLICEWFSLMIVIDFVRKKDIKGISVNIISVAYILLTFGMLFRRNGRMEPVLLLFPLGLFAMTRIDDEKWRWLVKKFLFACLGCFLYFGGKSLLTSQYEGGHYYGCFTNVGIFGLYAAVMFAASILTLLYVHEKYGVKSPAFVLAAIWLVMVCILSWMIDTRAMMAGILFVLAAMFLLCRKDTSKKAIIRRIIIVLGIVILAAASLVLLIKLVDTSNYFQAFDAENSYFNSGFLAPFWAVRNRINYVARSIEGNTLAEKIINLVDVYSSGRVTIAKLYAENFNYEGNPFGYFMWNDYVVFSAHNHYIQFTYDYGYFSIVELMVLIIGSLIVNAKKYLLTKDKLLYLLPILWIAATLGGWLGEAANFYYPCSFFSLMFITKNLFVDCGE